MLESCCTISQSENNKILYATYLTPLLINDYPSLSPGSKVAMSISVDYLSVLFQHSYAKNSAPEAQKALFNFNDLEKGTSSFLKMIQPDVIKTNFMVTKSTVDVASHMASFNQSQWFISA